MYARRLALLALCLAPALALAEEPVDLRKEIAAAIAEARSETEAEQQARVPKAAVTEHPTAPAAAPPSAHGPAHAPSRPRAVSKGRPAQELAGLQDPEAIWDAMMQGNLRFVEGHPRTRETVQLRRSLAAGQKPPAIVLACSDSRVPPELLFDQSLGDLFVIRTAGNVADPVALGSIEYAVDHLHSPLLVVLGHEECGAVAAAASGQSMPSRNLDAIMRRINPAIDELRTCGSSPPIRRLRVEANTHHSHDAILRESAIIHDAALAGKLRVISAVYGLESGVVTRLGDAPAAPAHTPGPPITAAHAPHAH